MINKFNQTSKNLSASGLILFHGMPCKPEGNFIRPGNKRLVNGNEDSYVFASPYLSKTLQHAFSWATGDAIIGGSIENTPEQFVVLCNRTQTLQKPLYLRVYSFAGDGFTKTISGSAYINKENRGKIFDTREYHSKRPVPFSKARIVLETNDINALMKKGLQILATEQSYEMLEKSGFLEECRNKTSQKLLEELLSSPDFIWENKARAINVNVALLENYKKNQENNSYRPL